MHCLGSFCQSFERLSWNMHVLFRFAFSFKISPSITLWSSVQKFLRSSVVFPWHWGREYFIDMSLEKQMSIYTVQRDGFPVCTAWSAKMEASGLRINKQGPATTGAIILPAALSTPFLGTYRVRGRKCLLRVYADVRPILDPGWGDNLKEELLPPIDKYVFFKKTKKQKNNTLPGWWMLWTRTSLMSLLPFTS